MDELRKALLEKAEYLRREADGLLDNTAGSVRKHDKMAMAHWLEQQVRLSEMSDA